MAITCPKCQFENPDDTLYCGKCAAQLQPELPAPTRTMQMPSLQLSAGQVFAGRYEVINELGRGGMGRVYKALDTEVNEKIAIKLTFRRLNDGITFAKSIYMLGKICEKQGKKGKAIEHYEKFLDLWNDADPGIAEVEDARSRLAELH